MANLVIREDRDGIAILTLNRPERRNAMIPEMMAELAETLRQPAERAFIITGAGAAFCVGADLKWMNAEPDAGVAVATLVARHHDAVRAIRQAAAPVITAVNGAAAGGGLSLALAGDWCLAAGSATFTAAYFKLGLTPDGGNSAFLLRAVGAARAMELLLTNRTLRADEALQWGLAHQVAHGPDLLAAAGEAAARFVRVPPATLLRTRQLLDAAGSQPLPTILDQEEVAVGTAARSPFFKQAIDAFLNKTA